MRRRAILILVLGLACQPAVGGIVETPYDDLVLEYPSGAERLARRVVELFPHLKELVEAPLGRPYRIDTRIVLCRNRAELVAAAGTEEIPVWALAVALSGRSLIAIRTIGIDGIANDLRSTLLHEMVHLVLGRIEIARGRALPLWFHEGVAEWASDSLHLGADPDLGMAALGERLIPFDELTDRFPADRTEATLAYAQSRHFVEDLARRHGGDAIGDILDRFEAGQEFDAAFESQLGLTRPEAEARWRQRLLPAHPVLYVLIRSLTLFSLASLLVVAAWWRYRQRARRQLAEWDEEEEDDDDEFHEPTR